MPLVILVDDTRTFIDDVDHVRCRTSAEGLAALPLLREQPGGELWLDHDLGKVAGDDGVVFLDRSVPVLDELSRAAFDGDPYPVARVVVHTSNPSGAETLLSGLRRWAYPVVRVSAGDYLVEEGRTDPDLDGSGAPTHDTAHDTSHDTIRG